ncbi:hypothetical protein [Atopobium fossor]|uniref:hypothetical protein n=1 Tax=Atopobium fossor TaxID=39487 RepID=UPI000684BF27|nr:hypothetical protein [Atopobium fossor]
MKTRVLRISVALFGLLAIAGIIFLLGALREANHFKKGIIDGFNIDGVYREHQKIGGNFSFHTEGNNRWQMVDFEGNITNGTFKIAEDPNIFFLTDAEENEYGVVHLAYVSPEGDQGYLYLKNKSGTVIVFDKVSKHPGFMYDNGSIEYFN